jgi:hypothetical protein
MRGEQRPVPHSSCKGHQRPLHKFLNMSLISEVCNHGFYENALAASYWGWSRYQLASSKHPKRRRL